MRRGTFYSIPGISIDIALALLMSGCSATALVSPPLKIAVDVGHSLARPGAVSARGTPEFEFNRELALTLRQALDQRGFRAQLIGERGDMDELPPRTQAAKGAGFFLSIHHDSVQPHYLAEWETGAERRRYSDRFSGFSLFVSRHNPDLRTSLACASAIGHALREQGFSPTKHHAEPIPGENRPFADEVNGVHYFDELVVLKTAAMPAVLVEAGIIVNREDELLLQMPATRSNIAHAITRGLERCLWSSKK